MGIQTDSELEQAVARMRLAKTDVAECELKDASNGFPKSTVETVSAFANTVGGTIVFGITEKGFHATGAISPKEIQVACAQAARELVEPQVPVDIHVLLFENKPVVVVNVPELPVRQKPCYVRKLGLVNGSYIRTGDGDHKMSLYEIDRFIENQQRSARNDAVIVSDATPADLDPELVEGWLAHVRRSSFGRMDDMEQETVMANRRVLAEDDAGVLRPTVAGIMALGAYPQKFFPRLNVVFSSYATTQKGDVASSSRFADSANIDGPIPEMILGTLRAVSRNMRHGAIVKGALREEVPDYPLAAVREAVANALMHRDYSVESQGSPVLVDLYPDRLEITNPGGLYGLLTVQSLGTRGGTASRNQFLARILEDVPYTDVDGTTGHVVENRGTGYPIITGELEKALMDKPVVSNSLDRFCIVFRRRKMTEGEGAGYTRANVEEAIMAYFAAHESAATADVARAAGIATKTARGYINKLIDEGVLEGIGSKYSPQRRYRLRR